MGSMIGEDTLPSELFARYSGGLESFNHEEIIQNTLSALAAQSDLIGSWPVDEIEEMPIWMWKTLVASENSEKGTQESQQEAPKYEWWMGLRLIRSLLAETAPFQLHAVASQSIVFTDGSQAHWILCLFLCVYALRQCPRPIQKRWRRWQSLICETIRMFQNYGVELGRLSVPIWVRDMIPACLLAKEQLPSEAYHMAILSSLIGTTSGLVSRECQRYQNEKDVMNKVLANVPELLGTIQTIVDGASQGYTVTWVFLNPWRLHASQYCMEETSDDEVDFLEHQDDISWWSQCAYRHERVAEMDTRWNDLGISLLALVYFDNRPMVYTPNYTWKVWFPHVSILFKTTGAYSSLEHLPLVLLNSLFGIVPSQSLPTISSSSTKPDAPFETFQLLSNRLLPRQANDTTLSKEQELESSMRSQRIVTLLKSLLTRYQPINQVNIIKKLVHDCPHPGLQAKFLDLLRPVLFDEEAHDVFWTYLNSFVRKLMGHLDSAKGCLVGVDDLVQEVEIYVGAITMIQLWGMVKGKLPKRIKGPCLGSFHETLKTMLGSWTTDSHSTPPDNYYRLFLLEAALEQIVQMVEDESC